MNRQRFNLLVLCLAVALLCSACGPSAEEAMFEKLLATDFGSGVKLGIPAGQITPTLGVPAATVTKQGGTLIEHYYLPDRETTAAADRPQLTLSYLNEQLVRIHNFERPFEDDPAQPAPPHKVAIMPGLALGARKSEFTSKLGQANYGALKDQWRFTGEDGRSIAIQAFFTPHPDTQEPICTKLTITLAALVEQPRGEQYEKK